MYEPSDVDIREELAAQSDMLFGSSGLGGLVGPVKEQFDRERPEGWPHSRSILKMFGLSRDAEGWKFLLRAFGFMPPSNSEIQTCSLRRREPNPTRSYTPIDDDYYPGLMGSIVRDEIYLTPLEDGRFQQTTRSVYQLR